MVPTPTSSTIHPTDVPGTLNNVVGDFGDAVQEGYEDFKKWLWEDTDPSRQPR